MEEDFAIHSLLGCVQADWRCVCPLACHLPAGSGATCCSCTAEPERAAEPEPSAAAEPEPGPALAPAPVPGPEPEPVSGGDFSIQIDLRSDGPVLGAAAPSASPGAGGTSAASAQLVKAVLWLDGAQTPFPKEQQDATIVVLDEITNATWAFRAAQVGPALLGDAWQPAGCARCRMHPKMQQPAES